MILITYYWTLSRSPSRVYLKGLIFRLIFLPFPAVGKNQPLKRGAARWCSSQPIYKSQLKQKRDEFWDTAPAFEGRQEIWDALRSAAEAAERGDHEMAQAIIDSASIILPTGAFAFES